MSDDKTQQENNLGWHFTLGDKLRDGRPIPKVGEALRHEGPIEICRSGLHCSERLVDALRYAPGATLHQVRFGVDVLRESDKLVSRERVILRTLPQNEALLVLVEFAQWCARRAEEARAAAMEAAMAAAWAARAAAMEAAMAAAWAARAAAMEAEEAAEEAGAAAKAAAADRAAAWAAWAAEEAGAAAKAETAAAKKEEREIQNTKLTELVEAAFAKLEALKVG